jgi:peptidoglycan/LPS O-acetylase OafA/YrhL
MNSPSVPGFGPIAKKSKVYFDYLDSLRFFAFLAVFIAHAGILFPISANWFYWLYRNVISHGAYGVNFFFVLSGFLITFLLLKEKSESTHIDIPFFYLKRVLRIWPVYFVVFFVAVFILPIIVRVFGAEYIAGSGSSFVNMGMHTDTVAIFAYLFLVGNIVQGYDLGVLPFALGVLWSVCVEEQFYLIWPWFMKKLSKRLVALSAILLFFISLIYKAIHINDANIAYYSTLSVSMDLASGVLLAVYYSYKKGAKDNKDAKQNMIEFKKPARKIEQRNLFLLVVLNITLYSCVILYMWTERNGFTYDFLRLMKRPVLDILFVIILIFFLEKKARPESIKGVSLKYRPFTYLGKISYGLYAYHAICVIGVMAIFNHYGTRPNNVTVFGFLAIFVLSLTLTIFLSHISYQYMEKRALRQKDRIAIHRARF